MLSNIIYIALLTLTCFACNKSSTSDGNNKFEVIDVSKTPNISVIASDKKLVLNNGIYYYNGNLFSGYIKDYYNTDTLKSESAYYKGKQHGISKTYFPNGILRDQRSYKDNLAYGRHLGFWQNGNMKFDFMYYNEKRDGLQKQWYEEGNLYTSLMFKDDKEVGMQKAWRKNGKLYINYEVKDGIRYGLQKSALCYTLRDGEIK